MASITIEDIITFLLEAPMFGDLDATGLSQIVHIMQVQRVRDGHAIFREGDPGDAWYVLYQGAADVLKESDFLPSRTIATIGPRACFGEMALLDHSPRSATVVARGDVTVAIPYTTSKRGRLDPGRVTLATRYPLGLFQAWSYPHPCWSCVVYPRPLRTPLPRPSPGTQADHHHGDSGQEDFAGLRPRQPSDPTRHIAWKAVARCADEQMLLVKQFAGGASDELWLDWSLTPPEHGHEDRLSILTGWVMAADEQQARYGLTLPGQQIAPAQGNVHRTHCLQALALYSESAP